MAGLDEQFLDRENFHISFKKVSFFLRQLNEWYDPVKLAEYEAILPSRIEDLTTRLKDGTYSPQSLQPLPFPKKNLPNGKRRIRPYYNVNLDDQLIWMAIVNVISELIEKQMPEWSYGNRLYRPIWFEKNINTGKTLMKKGSCKNTSANIYRKWGQSWPLYKRHISLTIKTMSKTTSFSKEDIEDEKELKIYENAESTGFDEIRYLNANNWETGQYDKLYWASLDFESFFPSIDPRKIIKNISSSLIREDGSQRDDISLILSSIEKMLYFPTDTTGWTNRDLQAKNSFNLENIDHYRGLPTGLVVGGFLANAAVLDTDRAIDKYIKDAKNVAVFKYVDDQVILCQSKESLLDFLNFYHNNLTETNPTVRFQKNKIEPAIAIKYDEKVGFTISKKYGRMLELDVDFPNPLMTNTLKKVSHINNIDFNLLEKDEISDLEIDLKHFLLTDFPTTEIRKDTKMSFAAGKLCRLAKEIRPNFLKIDPLSIGNIDEVHRIYKALYTAENISVTTDEKELENFKTELKSRAAQIFAQNMLSIEIEYVRKRHDGIFKLLLKALKDNPDKVKLWKRCVEFCFYTGYPGLRIILKTIKECEIHVRSQKYLSAYCITNIQVNLEKAFSELNSDNILFWRMFCCSEFILDAISIPEKTLIVKSKDYPFHLYSTRNFILSKRFVLENLNDFPASLEYYHSKNFRERLNLLRLTIRKDNNKRVLPYYNERAVWYYLSRLNWEKKTDFFSIYANQLELERPLSWSILSLFPKLIPANIIEQIINWIPKSSKRLKLLYSEMSNLTWSNGYTYEMLDSIKVSNLQSFNQFILHYPKLNKILNRNTETYIALDKWLNAVVTQNADANWLDPRLSEWTLIEIVRQIIDRLQQKFNEIKITFSRESNSDYYLMHPANYLVPIQWLDEGKTNWTEWQKKMAEYPIKLAEKDELIDDHRYFPIQSLWHSHVVLFMGNADIPLIIGLSVLLVKLLSKTFSWPPSANKINFIDQFYSSAYAAIERETLSSDLRILLGAIFSKTDWDIFYQYAFIKLSDDKSIQNLNDFNSYLTEIQHRLSKAQWNVIDREARQLVYINIDDLNESKNNFFEKL